MNNSRLIFNSLLQQAVSEDYSFIPKEIEIEHTFSEKFNKKISAISFPDELSIFPLFRRKNILLLTAVILLLLFTIGCSVPQIKNAVKDFFDVEYKRYFTVYWNSSVISEELDQKYLPTEIPDGYKEVHSEETENRFYTVYEGTTNSENYKKIEFIQALIPEDGVSFYKRWGILKELDVDGIQGYIYTSYGTDYVICQYNGFIFEAVCHGNVELNDVFKMLKSLNPVE